MIDSDFAPPAGFALLTRASWAATATSAVPADSVATGVVDARERREIHVPLRDLIVGRREPGDRPCLIGVAGSVSAGKSTFAATLASLFDDAVVVSTDGFLLPNAVLGPRAGYKGFPDTYDHDLIRSVCERLVAGDPDVTVPRYSHEIYDICGEPQQIGAHDVVILEGINALADPAPYCDLGVYLDAAEADLRSWYVSRFLARIEAGRSDPTSFFRQWVELGDDEARSLAVSVWEAVNLPNLDENILPTRWNANVVLRKAIDHSVTAVAVRS